MWDNCEEGPVVQMDPPAPRRRRVGSGAGLSASPSGTPGAWVPRLALKAKFQLQVKMCLSFEPLKIQVLNENAKRNQLECRE